MAAETSSSNVTTAQERRAVGLKRTVALAMPPYWPSSSASAGSFAVWSGRPPSHTVRAQKAPASAWGPPDSGGSATVRDAGCEEAPNCPVDVVSRTYSGTRARETVGPTTCDHDMLSTWESSLSASRALVPGRHNPTTPSAEVEAPHLNAAYRGIMKSHVTAVWGTILVSKRQKTEASSIMSHSHRS
jgi:hypothetical protein